MKPPPDVLNLLVVLGILVGVVQCFFGYRIFKVLLGVTGFVVGGGLAGWLAYANTQEPAIAIVAGLLAGFIGAALLVALYFVGIFLFGAILGGVVGGAVFAIAQTHPEPVVLLVFVAVGGVIALISQKLMIIVSTAFSGAWSVVLGIAHIATGAVAPTSFEGLLRPGGRHRVVMILCWLVLGAIGVIYQYRSAKITEKEKKARLTGQKLAASPERP
ncbi:MAG: DUF4203 domain-containing protein [Verrucomicrobia bacterium]|nr:DUF4203 domain-containing protein [Verrucomicrobiota bacterium]